ncbi:MAG TPA: hypothetical protein VF773_17455 [Verrucomicrobiae bacterium]
MLRLVWSIVGEFVLQCIGFFFDWVPYAIGRVALFILSLGRLRCEKWESLIWDTDLFGKPWWMKVDGKIVVTAIGVRAAGSFVVVGLLLAIAVPVGWVITRFW